MKRKEIAKKIIDDILYDGKKFSIYDSSFNFATIQEALDELFRLENKYLGDNNGTDKEKNKTYKKKK